jgi:hypothetical protein
MQQASITATARAVSAVLLFMLSMPVALASSFSVEKVDISLHQNAYLLDAHLAFNFSEEVLEAIDNGVPLTMMITVKVQQQRDMLWDKTVAEIRQVYTLRYHALSSQYIVRNLNQNNQETYISRSSAIRHLGELRALPVIQQQQLNADKTYLVSIKPRMDIESLPAPMRPWAWFSGNWHLNHEGGSLTWPLR